MQRGPTGIFPPIADSAPPTATQIRAVADGLIAAGLDAQVHDTDGTLDITAILRRDGRKDIDAIVDEDGYVEVRYWNPPGATPAQIAAVVSSVMATLTELL